MKNIFLRALGIIFIIIGTVTLVDKFFPHISWGAKEKPRQDLCAHGECEIDRAYPPQAEQPREEGYLDPETNVIYYDHGLFHDRDRDDRWYYEQAVENMQ